MQKSKGRREMHQWSMKRTSIKKRRARCLCTQSTDSDNRLHKGIRHSGSAETRPALYEAQGKESESMSLPSSKPGKSTQSASGQAHTAYT